MSSSSPPCVYHRFVSGEIKGTVPFGGLFINGECRPKRLGTRLLIASLSGERGSRWSTYAADRRRLEWVYVAKRENICLPRARKRQLQYNS